MRTEQRDPVVKALRRMKATKFLVTLSNGDIKTLSLSSKRNRWDDLSRLLESLDWRRIEGQDDKGVTLGVLAGEGDDVGELDDDELDDAGPLPDEVAKYVKIMQGCYHDAMTQTRAMFSDQLSGLGGMVETMVSAMRVQQESYAAAMKLQAATLTQPEGEGESDPTQKMLEIAAALYMQNPQMLMGLLKKAPAPAKPPAPEVVQRAKTPAPDTRRNPAKPLQNGARARAAAGDIITIPVDKTS
jgi:hypothetical protein